MKTRFFLLLLIITASSACLFGQKSGKRFTVTGYAVDGTEASIANALIMVDGEQSGILTDSKGYYKIKVKSDNKKIGVFTYTDGMIEEDINGRTRINFKFAGTVPDQKTDKILPFEETIDNGFDVKKRRQVTTSIGKIDGTQSKYASYNSIYDMIRGEIPGVIVRGNSIMIRGATTVYGSTEPMFVVDGVPVGTVENIDPRMVKSIQVLKGSAASIYGSRGSNGVIVINLRSAGDK